MAGLYLISPEDFLLDDFAENLRKIFALNKVAVFQLRLKNRSLSEISLIIKAILPICHEYGVPFILNDYVELLRDHEVDGVHLGESDAEIARVRNEFGKELIIGASCYNSKHLAMLAGEAGASYVAYGSFFTSQTKNTNKQADLDILNWSSKYLNLPCCAIGGINHENVNSFKATNVDFICVIGAIWKSQLGPVKAVEKLAKLISDF